MCDPVSCNWLIIVLILIFVDETATAFILFHGSTARKLAFLIIFIFLLVVGIKMRISNLLNLSFSCCLVQNAKNVCKESNLILPSHAFVLNRINFDILPQNLESQQLMGYAYVSFVPSMPDACMYLLIV